MQGARRGGEGVLANEDPPPQPRENVPAKKGQPKVPQNAVVSVIGLNDSVRLL